MPRMQLRKNVRVVMHEQAPQLLNQQHEGQAYWNIVWHKRKATLHKEGEGLKTGWK